MRRPFLRKQGGSYSYPANPDESLVSFKDMKVLPDPHFDRRGHFFLVKKTVSNSAFTE